jgi:uncharacterized membrane protein
MDSKKKRQNFPRYGYDGHGHMLKIYVAYNLGHGIKLSRVFDQFWYKMWN